mgnify:CR=1 FL=1
MVLPGVAAGVRLRTVWTPGHSPGHLCFLDLDRALLRSGDHVLPRITPVISVHPQQRHDPLEKVRALPVEEVLPAHEYRFAGLADRGDAMVAHHAGRLEEIARQVEQADAAGVTAWAPARRLTWSRPWEQIRPFMRRSALLETLAHPAAGRRHGGTARQMAGCRAVTRCSTNLAAATCGSASSGSSWWIRSGGTPRSRSTPTVRATIAAGPLT